MTTQDKNVALPRAATINERVIEQLEGRLRGRLIRPGETDYGTARAVWNGMIDRHPALIIACMDTNDVVAAVNFAREHLLPVAVRGGSHGVAGHATCDGGLVIDLSRMKGITVNPDARLARAEAGVTWGELDAATQAYGLATPGGVFSRTGIAGLTLGGGFGWLRSKLGFSCDNLVAARVVTANGEVIHASETERPDLLWGLHGGGGNFGVVTEFEYRLHPVGPEVMFAFVLHDGEGEHMAQAIQFYRDFCATAPDEASTIAACGIVPPHDDTFPAAIHRRPYVLFGGLYTGPITEGKQVLRPLIEFGTPLIDFSAVKPYIEAQQAFDADYPDGLRYYWKSLNLVQLDDAVIDRLAKHAHRQPSVLSTTDLWDIRGAVRRKGAEDAAFHGREAPYLLNVEANWEDQADDDANIAWVREFIADMREFSDGGRYLNFAGFQEEGDEMMRNAFGAHYERLAALKAKYDPNNLFHLNQNIKPATKRT